MSDFRSRMRTEHDELTERLIKLTAFLWTPKFHELADDAKHLLVAQQVYMKGYVEVLSRRISLAG